MSRHQLVKTMDLDDELDDFDGGDDYDDGGDSELTEEDKEQLRLGTIEVRNKLPKDTRHITDKQIQDSLWHYYYDVSKTVAYLVNTHITIPKKKAEVAAAKKAGGFDVLYSDVERDLKRGAEGWMAEPAKCSTPAEESMTKSAKFSAHFSFADFFKDMPWLNTPLERHALFVEPLLPRGGLLGGSSDGTPKMSKLQALAAARKKKAQEQRSGSSGVEKPMSELSKNGGTKADQAAESPSKPSSRGFPIRKRKDSNPHEKQPAPSPVKYTPEVAPDAPIDAAPIDAAPIDQAEPSAFASTMFSSPLSPAPSANHFSLPYTATTITAADPFAGPSPDDVVKAAQSKASGKGGKGPPKTNGEKKADQIASGVEAMKMDDTPRSRSKNLDVLKEWDKIEKKKEANFVVIGHVDAGKSTLMGRLLYDLKVIDERTIARYRSEAEKMGKSSFALAWVLDQGSEERARGVTIDIATNKFSTDKTNFIILDAPGHRDFIPNMIAGASQADFAVLVIDASTGSFESGLKGQTKEHALLVRSMGVQRIIIAINKLDTVAWSEDRFTEISQQISAFLTAAGFLSKNITFIPCSGLHGENIVRKSTEAELTSWYTGPTIVEELENSEPITRALTKPLRITIGDIFRGGVQNPLSISGRIESGSLQTGDALFAQPAGQKAFIKSLDIDSEPADWAVAGQNVTIHLSDIDAIHLKIGDVLSSPSSPIQNVKQFTAKVLAFEFLTPMQVDVHRGRLHTPGRIKEIIAVLDKGTGRVIGGKKKPRIVKPGAIARVIVELDSAVPLEAPGRVVLRAGGETMGAGLLE